MTAARAPRRATRPMVAKVQIARKELQLDDATYRAILQRLTGKSSSTACTDAQLGVVLDEFVAKGWKPKTGSTPRQVVVNPNKAPARTGMAPIPADHPAAKKARALWISLHQLGVMQNPADAALEAFARRQLRVERLQWARGDQMYKLIEALKAIAEREGWSQSTEGLARHEVVPTLKRRLLAAIHKRLGTPAPPCALTALDTAISLAASALWGRA